MITYRSITTLEQFTLLVPLFLEGYKAMNKKGKVFEVNEDGFLQTLIGILNTVPKNGIVVAFDEEEPIGYGAAFEDTPAFAEKRELLMWALYVKPSYPGGVVVNIVEEAKRLAKKQGYQVMKAFNARFTGGMYRLFEDRLGMRRHRIQFNLSL